MSAPPLQEEQIPEEIGETQILAALLGIAEMVGDLTDTHELLDAIVRIAPSLVRVNRCAYLAHDAALRELYAVSYFAPAGKGSVFEGLRIPESEMPRLAQRLAVQRLPALVKDSSKDITLPPSIVRSLGVKSVLLVPLASRGRFLGCLWLDHTSQSHYFTSKEINVMQAVAMEVALALDNAERTKSLGLENRRFAALSHAVSDGVIVLGPDLRILAMDRAAEDLLGWSSSEVRGRHVHEVFDITEAEAGVAWRREAGGIALASKELKLRTHDGAHIPCEVLTIPVRGEDGEVAQILYVLRNLLGVKGIQAKAMDALHELAMAQGDARPE
ncbi:MAG TPA: GAF domain-containing protein [Thermoplasmata archaeon]